MLLLSSKYRGLPGNPKNTDRRWFLGFDRLGRPKKAYKVQARHRGAQIVMLNTDNATDYRTIDPSLGVSNVKTTPPTKMRRPISREQRLKLRSRRKRMRRRRKEKKRRKRERRKRRRRNMLRRLKKCRLNNVGAFSRCKKYKIKKKNMRNKRPVSKHIRRRQKSYKKPPETGDGKFSLFADP